MKHWGHCCTFKSTSHPAINQGTEEHPQPGLPPPPCSLGTNSSLCGNERWLKGVSVAGALYYHVLSRRGWHRRLCTPKTRQAWMMRNYGAGPPGMLNHQVWGGKDTKERVTEGGEGRPLRSSGCRPSLQLNWSDPIGVASGNHPSLSSTQGSS